MSITGAALGLGISLAVIGALTCIVTAILHLDGRPVPQSARLFVLGAILVTVGAVLIGAVEGA